MARRKQYVIADGATGTPTIVLDGNYPASPGYIDWEGGHGELFVIGGFGGGTGSLQIQAPDGSTWVSVGSGTSFTAAGVGGFLAAAGRLRLNVTGSTTPTIKSWAVGIPTNNGG